MANRGFLLGQMNDKEQRSHYIGFIELQNQLNAAYFIYKEHSADKAKNCFYEAALAQAYCIEKLGQDPFRIVTKMLYCILSDNRSIIERFKTYRATPEYEKIKDMSFYFGMALQAVLENDSARLEEAIPGVRKRSENGPAKAFAGAALYFEGILNNDGEKVNDGIISIQKKLQKHQVAIVAEYMNIEATGLLKLAWRKGFEIPSPSSYVPASILPVLELKEYDSYDFFSEPG